MLYICEYSLHFFKRKSQLIRHLSKCRVKHPPGEEIYRNGSVCMFEVDGHKEKTYSQVWKYGSSQTDRHVFSFSLHPNIPRATAAIF